MANIKLIGMTGQRMTPRGSGWEIDGLFFGTWSAAYTYLHDGEIPTSEQVQQREDDRADYLIQWAEERAERTAEQRMLQI